MQQHQVYRKYRKGQQSGDSPAVYLAFAGAGGALAKNTNGQSHLIFHQVMRMLQLSHRRGSIMYPV